MALKFHRDGDGLYVAYSLKGTYTIRRYERYFNLAPRPATYTYWDLYYTAPGEEPQKISYMGESLKRNAVIGANEHHNSI